MINEVLADTDDRMNKTIESLRVDLNSISVGRASPALLDRVQVDYYGTPTPIQQIATIIVPDARLLQIRPYAASDIGAIKKAIANSDLNLNPQDDGQNIRISIPALTQERRRDLTKVVGKRGEEARVAIRNVRRDAINDLRELEKEKLISEDDLRRGQDQIQDKTNAHIKKVDDIIQDKEKDIMTI
jgi:ribosome recycling factor